jgi:putative ABC transport system ATP-binding protein
MILADEPTGALDSKTGKEVLQMLKDLNKEGNTIIMITHDKEIAAEAERIITVRDGRIISDSMEEGELSS